MPENTSGAGLGGQLLTPKPPRQGNSVRLLILRGAGDRVPGIGHTGNRHIGKVALPWVI